MSMLLVTVEGEKEESGPLLDLLSANVQDGTVDGVVYSLHSVQGTAARLSLSAKTVCWSVFIAFRSDTVVYQ